MHKRQDSDYFLYPVGSKSCSKKYDIRVDRMMESDVAKPLRMLSAYLMTAAMTRPPSAWRNNKHTDTDGQRHDLSGPRESDPPNQMVSSPRGLVIHLIVKHHQRSETYLQCYDGPGDCVVTLEHSRLFHPLAVVEQHAEKAKHKTKHPWKHTHMQCCM